MTKMIQIRNVPDDLHAKLKARAAEARLSLSDYLLGELERSADQMTDAEILRRLERLESIDAPQSSAEIIRELRDRE